MSTRYDLKKILPGNVTDYVRFDVDIHNDIFLRTSEYSFKGSHRSKEFDTTYHNTFEINYIQYKARKTLTKDL